jgi:DNA-binding response OmpR family regulator
LPDFKPHVSSRILLVEDEESLSIPIRRGLEEEGYRVTTVADARRGITELSSGDYDIAVIDWRLPGMDGRSMIEHVRREAMPLPILMLTAMRSVDHRIAGLDAGADDYLTKPFAFDELLARLRALLRRTQESAGSYSTEGVLLRLGGVEMDTSRRTAALGPHPLDLRAKEYSLLEVLVRLGGHLATRTLIAESVWGSAFDVTDNAIDITVSNLRSRLMEPPSDDAWERVTIETVRGIGYRLSLADTPDHKPGS